MKGNTDWGLIKRWLDGEKTEQNRKKIEQWLLENPENIEVLQELEGRWIEAEDEEFDSLHAFDVLSKKLDDKTRVLVPEARSKRFSWLRIAVSLLFLTAVGLGALWLSDLNKEVKALAYITKTTGRGQLSKVTLMDGTVVQLNSGSSIRYPENYGASTREIILTGEAYFDVVRDTLHPFMVKTGEITTTVLGTSFNVRAFSKEDVEVTVTTGKVNVRKEGKDGKASSLDLLPGEQALYRGQNRELVFQKVETAPYLAWMERSVSFRKLPFPQALDQLSRVYNVRIENTGNRGAECLVRGKYQNQSLEEILKGLQLIVDFDYEFKNDSTLLINTTGCTN